MGRTGSNRGDLHGLSVQGFVDELSDIMGYGSATNTTDFTSSRSSCMSSLYSTCTVVLWFKTGRTRPGPYAAINSFTRRPSSVLSAPLRER